MKHDQCMNAHQDHLSIQCQQSCIWLLMCHDYLAKVGVDPLAFVKVFNSFGVQSSLRQADARVRAYRATGVPTIIVHGKYRIETASAGSTQGMLKVAEYLIDLERQ